MLIDAYTTTCSYSSLEIRVITDTKEKIEVSIRNMTGFQLSPQYEFQDRYFYSFVFKNLVPETEYTITIQAGEEHTLKATTLVKPSGKRLFRFGLFGDPHIAGHDTDHDIPIERGPRLYSKATLLLQKYSKRVAELGADFLVLLGDIADPATEENMEIIKNINAKSKIPWYPIIGNHEPYCNGGEPRFYRTFGIPENGYYSKNIKKIHLIFLSTPSQSSLSPNGLQYKWLFHELEQYKHNKCFIFSHFAPVLHPCVQGKKNDGMQQLNYFQEIFKQLEAFPNVKVWFGGHKNIPSFINKNRIAHFLSPQLIQTPCGFDIVDVYENGLMRIYHEIDEQHFVWIARMQNKDSWIERCGTESDRNVLVKF